MLYNVKGYDAKEDGTSEIDLEYDREFLLFVLGWAKAKGIEINADNHDEVIHQFILEALKESIEEAKEKAT